MSGVARLLLTGSTGANWLCCECDRQEVDSITIQFSFKGPPLLKQPLFLLFPTSICEVNPKDSGSVSSGSSRQQSRWR